MAGGKRGGRPPVPEGLHRTGIAIPRSLAADIDAFIQEHQEAGIRNRNDFAARAIMDYLDRLREREYRRLVLEAYKEGKTGLPDLTKKAGVKTPSER